MKSKDFQSFIEQLPTHESSLHLLDYASLFRLKLIHGFVGDIKNKTVLDLGCGNGSVSYLLWYLGAKVYGLDISKQALVGTRNLGNPKQAGNGFESELLQGDATRLPFQPESFDLVFCIETLEHIQDDIAAVAEIEKVTKSGGTVVLAVPFNNRVAGDDGSLAQKYRYYSTKTINGRLFSGQLRLTRVLFWFFPLLKLLEMLRVRSFFVVLGYLVDSSCNRGKLERVGTRGVLANSLTTFYNTRFWRKVATPLLMHVLDFNMLFKNLPISDDVFLIYKKQ
ncbi:MAG: class I SAM-dependent methyltransferase [Candidatus Bathyarchaeia archaeon]|jgi:ubiquinone/menaquinone biosynthesis C-methylase UbiE